MALLQLATEKQVVLLRLGLLPQDQVAAACGPGTPLARLLSSPSLYLAGVGVTQDCELLLAQYGLSCRGVLELAPVASELLGNRKGAGLRALCRTILSKDLPKVYEIRCGDWLAQPLSDAAIEYAALDAEAGRLLLVSLHEESVRQAGGEGGAGGLLGWARAHARDVVELN